MSNDHGRGSRFSPPQQISGLLNHTSSSTDEAHLYPEPVHLHPSTPPGLEERRYEGQRSLTPGEVKSRLRKACDSCSVRKVKCDESGPPCRSCAALDIPCTFQRPIRRRGPPNRHAEAIKRQRLEQEGEPQSHGLQHDTGHQATAPLSVESICPLAILQLLIDDYFTYIHPLIPLPHEPTFRMQLQRRDDLRDSTFLALVANMIAVLVASFPRRPRQLLASEEMHRRFPNASALIKVCLRVAGEARGFEYLSGKLTLYDALCSYLTAITLTYTYDVKHARLYFAENLSIQRSIGTTELVGADESASSDPGTNSHSNMSDVHGSQDIDYVEQEMVRRLFWVSYVSNVSLRQLGSKEADHLIPALSRNMQPPPLPMEIDDAWISNSRIYDPPAGLVSELVGFNTNVRVMRACNALVAAETAVGLDEVNDFERQKRIIMQCLEATKHATDSVPPELVLGPSSPSGWPSVENPYYHMRRTDVPPIEDPRNSEVLGALYSRRQVQYEIQKANIYATQLGTRSYLVEKYWSLCRSQARSESQKPGGMISHQDPTLPTYEHDRLGHSNIHGGKTGSRNIAADKQAMALERDHIIQDLGVLLSSITQVNMEPNGLSITHKVRSIAATLLERSHWVDIVPSSLDYDSIQQYLVGFIDILMKLEHLGPGLADGSTLGSPSDRPGWAQANSGLTAEEIEERELSQWASLKEHQQRFAEENGFVRGF